MHVGLCWPRMGCLIDYIPRIGSTSSTRPIFSISSASSRTRNFKELKSIFSLSMRSYNKVGGKSISTRNT